MADFIQRDDYEEIVVAENETFAKVLGNGETYEHKLIDITNTGATVHLRTEDASNWTLRNIGIRGEHPGAYNCLNASVPASDGTGLVEHVYFADGIAGDNGGFWVHRSPEHRGDLTYRRVHVGLSPNRGLDARMPGAQGDPGTITVEDSYFDSNNIVNVRVGTAAATTSIRNTVVEVTGDVRASNDGTVDAVGVEARHGAVELDGVDIDTGGYGAAIVEHTSSGGSVIETDVRTGSSADTTPPAGVPLTPEAAAAGETDSIAGTVTQADEAWRLTAPDGSDYTIPLYPPDDVGTPAFRKGAPTDQGDTGPMCPDFEPAQDHPGHALRVQTPDGVYAVSAATITMLEDFEHGQWPSDWGGETGGYSLTASALAGGYSLEMVGSPDFPNIVNANLSTPRGYDYSALVRPDGSSSRPGLMVNTDRVSGSHANGNFYMAHLSVDGGSLDLAKYTNGSRSSLDSVSVSASTGTTYRLGVRVRSGTVQAALTDANGTELAATAEVSDAAHSGGYLGWYVGGSSPYGTRVDDFQQHPAGTF